MESAPPPPEPAAQELKAQARPMASHPSFWRSATMSSNQAFSWISHAIAAPPELPPGRKKVAEFLAGNVMESIVFFFIAANVALVVLETNCLAEQPVLNPDADIESGPCSGGGAAAYTTEWLVENGYWTSKALTCWQALEPLNYCVLAFYICELGLRLYVHRLHFFAEKLSILDLVVVLIDVMIAIASSVADMEAVGFLSLLRLARLIKLSRAVRLMTYLPELNLMLRGFFSALSAIFWGVVMLVLILVICGIVAVQVVHPINMELYENGTWHNMGCERCPRAFSSVEMAVLTFTQQIIAGDSWGTVTVPLIEQDPKLAVFFVGVLCSLSLAIMNLILAVIVEKAQEAKADTDMERARKKEAEFHEHGKQLEKLCAEIDMDGSGNITLVEIMEGFRSNPEFAATLKSMDIAEEDMKIVFDILDQDGSGDVNYKEFVQQLHKMKSHDAHTLLVFIKFYVIQIKQRIEDQFKVQRKESQELDRKISVGRTMSEEAKNVLDTLGNISVEAQAPLVSFTPDQLNLSLDEEIAKMQQADKDMMHALRTLAERSFESHNRLLRTIQAGRAQLSTFGGEGKAPGNAGLATLMPKPPGVTPKAASADQPIEADADGLLGSATAARGAAAGASGSYFAGGNPTAGRAVGAGAAGEQNDGRV